MAQIQLDDLERTNKGREMIRSIMGDIRDRSIWLRKREIHRNLYYDNGRRLDVHWQGASDIHLPVIFEKIETMVPKLVTAFFGVDPIVTVRRPADDFDQEDTKTQEQFANWALRYDIPNFFSVVTSWFRNMLIDGVGVIKIRWERKWRDSCETHALKRDTRKGEVLPASSLMADQDTPKSNLELLGDIFGLEDIKRIDEIAPNTFNVDFVEDRRLFEDIRVEFRDSEYIDEINAIVYRPILIQDNPIIEVVEAEDFIVPYRTSNIQTAPRFAYQYWLTKEEIVQKTKIKDPRFRWDLTEEDIQRLEVGTGFPMEEIPENRRSKRVKDEIIGEFPNTLIHRKGNRYLILEFYQTDYSSENPREMVYQIPYILKKVAHAGYLDDFCPHGHRPFATIHFQSVSDRFYVPGMAERLGAINIQVNTTINQVNDNMELINNPIYFYVPAAMNIDPGILKNMPPGTGIPIHDPNAIHFPTWGQTPLANMQVMESIMMFADRITGLSPMSSGSSQMRNAPRTARGTLALISEGNIKTDILVTMAQEEGWSELLYQLFGLYAKFMPDEKWFWATGKDRAHRPVSISTKMLRGKFEFLWRGNATNTNPEVQRTLAQVRYNTAIANPLYQMDPGAMRELLRDFLMHFSEGTDVDMLLPNLPGMGTASHAPMTQRDENTTMAHGIPIEVLPTDNHQEHIQELDKFVNSQGFNMLPESLVALYVAHKQQHMSNMMAQMAQQQRAQIASGGTGEMDMMEGGGGGEQNVPQGMTLTGGTDLAALGGGVV